MENRRAIRSGRILLYSYFARGFSPILVSAAISLFALVAVASWIVLKPEAITELTTQYESEQRSDEPFSNDLGFDPAQFEQGTPITEEEKLANLGTTTFNQLIGSYVALKQSDLYTEEQGTRVANSIAADVRAEVPFTPLLISSVKTDSDTSFARVLTYRSDLRVALAPLLENTEAEFAIFARYVETGDVSNLERLETAAARYRKAAQHMTAVTVPKDAAAHHLNVINALLEFGITLEALVKHADNSMATLALLRAYNNVEADVLNSFNTLALYQKNKMP